MAIDCSALSSRTDFPHYISLLKNVSAYNLTKLESCKEEMCSALWGIGNPDISGIGMIVGYAMDLILGIALATAVMVSEHNPHSSLAANGASNSEIELQASRSPSNGPPSEISSLRQNDNTKREKRTRTLIDGFKTYADGAIFLAGSIQIAAVVVLVRKDFGINANGLGGITVQVTWTVCLLTMLPLVLLISLSSINLGRPHLRFFLVCICWVLFMYIFISRMIATYGPSQIGTGRSAVISPHDWAVLTNICLLGVEVLSRSEATALDVFGIGGSIFISLIILGKFFFCLSNQVSDSKEVKMKGFIYRTFHNKNAHSIILLGVLAFGVSQLWAIIRLRVFQQSMARTVLQSFVDNQWTFGQVVAVVVFAPVFVELIYSRFHPDGGSRVR